MFFPTNVHSSLYFRAWASAAGAETLYSCRARSLERQCGEERSTILSGTCYIPWLNHKGPKAAAANCPQPASMSMPRRTRTVAWQFPPSQVGCILKGGAINRPQHQTAAGSPQTWPQPTKLNSIHRFHEPIFFTKIEVRNPWRSILCWTLEGCKMTKWYKMPLAEMDHHHTHWLDSAEWGWHGLLPLGTARH